MNTSLDILVIEDHPLNRRLVRDLLTHHGHRIREAVSVADGLVQLDSSAADVVLLDIQLPDGDGMTVLEAIRTHPRWTEVPVVAVTAFAMRGDRQRLLESGFDGYVSKPIDVDHFAQYIESLAL